MFIVKFKNYFIFVFSFGGRGRLRLLHLKFSSLKEAKPDTSPPSCLPNVVAMTIVHSSHITRETSKRRENEKTQRGDIK